MDRYAVSVEGDTLMVDTDKHLTGPDRGAKSFLTPAKGPACSGGG
jgi:hypothetical protein